MHEWLSGGVSPCQGEGRGFESRLVLFEIKEKAFKIKLFPYFYALQICTRVNPVLHSLSAFRLFPSVWYLYNGCAGSDFTFQRPWQEVLVIFSDFW